MAANVNIELQEVGNDPHPPDSPPQDLSHSPDPPPQDGSHPPDARPQDQTCPPQGRSQWLRLNNVERVLLLLIAMATVALGVLSLLAAWKAIVLAEAQLEQQTNITLHTGDTFWQMCQAAERLWLVLNATLAGDRLLFMQLCADHPVRTFSSLETHFSASPFFCFLVVLFFSLVCDWNSVVLAGCPINLGSIILLLGRQNISTACANVSSWAAPGGYLETGLLDYLYPENGSHVQPPTNGTTPEHIRNRPPPPTVVSTPESATAVALTSFFAFIVIASVFGLLLP
jgi:hypothetical protein